MSTGNSQGCCCFCFWPFLTTASFLSTKWQLAKNLEEGESHKTAVKFGICHFLCTLPFLANDTDHKKICTIVYFIWNNDVFVANLSELFYFVRRQITVTEFILMEAAVSSFWICHADDVNSGAFHTCKGCCWQFRVILFRHLSIIIFAIKLWIYPDQYEMMTTRLRRSLKEKARERLGFPFK